MNNLFKQLKNSLIIGLLFMFTASGIIVFAVPEDEIDISVKPVALEEIDLSEPIALEEISSANDVDTQITNENLEEMEVAHKVSSGKKVLLKFAIAILWVLISSIIIYFSLISYKKISKKTDYGIGVEENTLNAPSNFKEAINLFLKKTKG